MLNKKEAATTKRHADEISPQYTSKTGSGNTASINDTVSSNNHEVKYSVATKHKIANAFDDTPTLLYFIKTPPTLDAQNDMYPVFWTPLKI